WDSLLCLVGKSGELTWYYPCGISGYSNLINSLMTQQKFPPILF
ncbi:hypothetical protein Leryth_020710, partial [Lithospermum erythrorhizon]